MASYKQANDEEISRLLLELSDEEPLGSDSECEDNLLQDEVQSDVEDAEERPPQFLNTEEDEPEPLISGSPSSNVPNPILVPQRQSLRGKDGHRWTATKGRTCNRVYSCNIIRTSKGPTRMNKCLYEPIECFSILITDEIVEEITKWTNAEIQLKIQRADVKATFKPCTCEGIRPLEQEEATPEPKKRKYCAFCPSKIRKMTKTMCNNCKNPICGEHKSTACPNCL